MGRGNLARVSRLMPAKSRTGAKQRRDDAHTRAVQIKKKATRDALLKPLAKKLIALLGLGD
jgi:hypothetical protein